MQITLSLWVSNQVGVNCDCTYHYIRLSGWRPPVGVVYDDDEMTLTGEAEATWAAFRDLKAVVAAKGHGDVEVPSDVGDPCLTACPVQIFEINGRWSAEECCARNIYSDECEAWADFARHYPELATTDQ